MGSEAQASDDAVSNGDPFTLRECQDYLDATPSRREMFEIARIVSSALAYQIDFCVTDRDDASARAEAVAGLRAASDSVIALMRQLTNCGVDWFPLPPHSEAGTA